LADDVACGKCAHDVAAVHNVLSRFAGHSTLNGDPDFQLFQWLPFLWGDCPPNFDYWKELCRLGDRARRELDKAGEGPLTVDVLTNRLSLSSAEQHLLHGPWAFPYSPLLPPPRNPAPLSKYVEEIVNTALPEARGFEAELLRRLPVVIFARVAAALKERKQPAPRHEVLSSLHPSVALLSAICEVWHTFQAEIP
jgi:hypothetical protein